MPLRARFRLTDVAAVAKWRWACLLQDTVLCHCHYAVCYTIYHTQELKFWRGKTLANQLKAKILYQTVSCSTIWIPYTTIFEGETFTVRKENS